MWHANFVIKNRFLIEVSISTTNHDLDLVFLCEKCAKMRSDLFPVPKMSKNI
ncbi:Uncharacterised protein [Vibrio cholerae]|nr:Uncharacterised protein [Vibrio cholerae]CRZ90644.1 Uncharacterised protein [Vibrio cholerae]CSB61886.1 Uncharacterised protein [Vibrio cholerae]CSB64977.1 Uncharacterised protein [Vibrio cholerae]